MTRHTRVVAGLALMVAAVGVWGGCDRGSQEAMPSAVAPMSAAPDLIGTVELTCPGGQINSGVVDHAAGESADVAGPVDQARRFAESGLADRFPGLRFDEQQTEGAAVVTLADDVGIRGVFQYQRIGSGWALTAMSYC